MLLGGPEPTFWPSEGMWVLTGAGGRARADGLLWVWGMGRALCTGFGLGSPDFIFEATRMAGIFSLAAWWPHTLLRLTLRGESCYNSARLAYDPATGECESVTSLKEHTCGFHLIHLLVELMCAICWCPGLGCSSWISAGGWAELPNMQRRGLKPTNATCFLLLFISCGKDQILLGLFCVQIETRKSTLRSPGKKIKIPTSH